MLYRFEALTGRTRSGLDCGSCAGMLFKGWATISPHLQLSEGARASGLGPRGSGLGPRARASGLGRSGLGARKTNSCFFLRFQEYIHINIYIYIENFLLSDPVFRLRNTSPPIHPSHVSNCGRPPCQTCRY